MGIVINHITYNAIYRYYMNMFKKFHHEWGIEEIHSLIDKTFDSIYQIENGLTRRKPTISRWNGLYMATSKDRKRKDGRFRCKAIYRWDTRKLSQSERFIQMFEKAIGIVRRWSEIKVGLMAA